MDGEEGDDDLTSDFMQCQVQFVGTLEQELKR
jgi:hypothetical protein